MIPLVDMGLVNYSRDGGQQSVIAQLRVRNREARLGWRGGIPCRVLEEAPRASDHDQDEIMHASIET